MSKPSRAAAPGGASPIARIAAMPGVPTRVRPFAKTQQPTPRWLRLVIGRDLAPSPAEYDRVCHALWKGDPAMDALVDWMYAAGPREARGLFETALERGIGAVPDAPEELKAFFRTVDRTPAWVDPALLADGRRFIHGLGDSALFVLRDLALMGGYLLSGFNQSLVATGALNKSTARRVAETGKWWTDCTEAGGLERFGPGFKTTLRVRMVHSLVRRGLAGGDKWDAATWGMPLSQVDMVGTYLGFSVVMLGGLRKLGIPVTSRESRAVMHLWSYACWLMGVDEEWLCAREGDGDGVVLLQHCMMTQSKADWTTRELGHALAQEPLERHFDSFEGLRRQLVYHKHLSTSRYFLGAANMEKLGLPGNVLPWYPVLTLLPRLAGYSARRFVPGLRTRLETNGRAIQIGLLKSMFGDAEQDVMTPGKGHPAHLS